MPLPSGFTAAPATAEAAAEIAAVVTASQVVDGGELVITPEELVSDWSGVDLATETLAIWDADGTMAGYADVDNQANVITTIYAYVHPEFRGRGVGTALRQWGEEYAQQAMHAAPSDMQALVQQFAPAQADTARQFLADGGYQAIRQTFVMAISLDRPVPQPVVPDGITLRAFVPGDDDLAVHEAVEDAFRDLWGRPPGTFERFAASMADPSFDPALWHIALAGDEIVATGLAHAPAEEGWIDVIGVRRPWRRQGVGLALLHSLFAAMRERGLTTAALSVDAESRTGAPRLYERAGMTVRTSYLRYRKELRPGKDATALTGA